ncbi:MAG: cob(I)yrinic acid a,c-diamide adenosyltransferase [Halobacteriaceae archaeon]
MKIYTGRGDSGQTDLHDSTRVSKTNPRVEAYGSVDELNALLGTIRQTGHTDIDDKLESIQNHLHVAQADLANPDAESDSPRIQSRHTEMLENWIDDLDEELEPLESFILPTGSKSGSALHHARTVCRRAERRVVEAGESTTINEQVLTYLNRLSDALFIFARVINSRENQPEDHPTY